MRHPELTDNPSPLEENKMKASLQAMKDAFANLEQEVKNYFSCHHDIEFSPQIDALFIDFVSYIQSVFSEFRLAVGCLESNPPNFDITLSAMGRARTYLNW
jgi:hypothetical protein